MLNQPYNEGETTNNISPTARIKPNQRRREIAFYDRRSRNGLTMDGEVFRADTGQPGDLLRALPAHIDTLYLLGKVPRRIQDLRKWARADLPDGWQHAAHYLDGPVFRFTNDGRRVEIHNGSAWAIADASLVDARRTIGELAGLLRRKFNTELSATARATGQNIFLSSIPFDKQAGTYRTWPVLPPEHQALIQETTGQGRIEFFGAPQTLDGFLELDGRLMYAACARELPVGPGLYTPPQFGRPLATQQDFIRVAGDLSFVPGRYRVVARVPDGWRHIGLLGVYADREWTYPNKPGQQFTTWADGCELLLLADNGWKFDVTEGITFDKAEGTAGPLDSWVAALLKLEERATPAAAKAIRSMIIMTIGAFNQRAHLVEKSSADPDAIPAGATPIESGGLWFWSEQTPPRHPEWSHPEWAAAVWAKARVRIAKAALEWPVEKIIGIGTDALWLNTADGAKFPTTAKAVGNLRRKAWHPGPLDPPGSLTELYTMKGAE